MTRITRHEREGVLVLAFKGKLTGVLLREVREVLAEGPREILLECSGLTQEDEPAVVALVEALGQFLLDGGKLKLLKPTARLSEIFEVVAKTQLASVFEVYETEAEAVASFAEAASEPEPAGPTVTENGGVELVQVRAGSFSMGSAETEKDRQDSEGPQHEVTLPAFEIGKYAVTNEEYGLYLDANPDAAKPPYWTKEDHNQPRQPVVGVSWDDAKAFAERAGCRLPSEAEWEYAARAGTAEPYLEGATEEVLGRFAWYSKNSEWKLHPVGEKQPNAWGLYDVLGNVWEWMEDDYHGSYQDAPGDGAACVDAPRGSNRVLRGGAFNNEPQNIRVASRDGNDPEYRGNGIGFRVVRSRSGGQE